MSSRDLLDVAWIVPALPAAGAVVLLLFGRRLGTKVAGWLATGLMALAFVMSCVLLAALLNLPSHQRSRVHNLWTWLPAGTLRVHFGVLADPLSVTWILFVTGVGTLIHLYSIGYMHGDDRAPRFFAFLNLFAASMLILVLGSTFLVTFLGWEGVGLCSYLLISYWFERPKAAVAGKKAFVTNRVGDVGFLIAMFLAFATYGTLDYSALGSAAKLVSSGTVTAIALLLMLAAAGKSAQFPLHVWLPDAMEGPTPVSALIHAATMVTAGVFLLCRAHAFLEGSADARHVVAWVGAGTALLAGTVAVVQPDIKRTLAYSTVSQLGYMFLGVGIGAYAAAIFMVVAHAFYKACLFLGAGSVIHGNHDGQDMRTMGGFRRYLPYTAFAMVIAWLAIAGIPPFAGFWAKDEIVANAYESGNYALWIVGIVAAGITAFYMTRLIFMTFYGNERWRTDADAAAHQEIAAQPVVAGGSDDAPPAVDDLHALYRTPVGEGDPSPTVAFGDPVEPPSGHAPHEAPALMTLPVLALAGLAVLGGLLDLPFKRVDFLARFLEPVFAGVPRIEPHKLVGGVALGALTFVVALGALLLAYLLYRGGLPSPDRDPAVERLGPVATWWGHAYYWDEGIGRLVGGPGFAVAVWLDRVVDSRIIDGAVNGVAKLFALISRGVQYLQGGLVRRYAVGIALGTVGLLAYMVFGVGR